jgi:hypothetical protein
MFSSQTRILEREFGRLIHSHHSNVVIFFGHFPEKLVSSTGIVEIECLPLLVYKSSWIFNISKRRKRVDALREVMRSLSTSLPVLKRSHALHLSLVELVNELFWERHLPSTTIIAVALGNGNVYIRTFAGDEA